MWTSALPQNGDALPLTWGHGPGCLIPKSTGASSLVRAAVELPARGVGAEGRAARQRISLLLLESYGFLGMRTAWCKTSPGENGQYRVVALVLVVKAFIGFGVRS